MTIKRQKITIKRHEMTTKKHKMTDANVTECKNKHLEVIMSDKLVEFIYSSGSRDIRVSRRGEAEPG